MQGDKLLIAVGRPNYEIARGILTEDEFLRYQVKNIFSYEKTREQICAVLDGHEYEIVPVQDQFNNPAYVAHVKQRFGDVGETLDDLVLVGENQRTTECFKENGTAIYVAEDSLGYHATDVRDEVYRTGGSERLAVGMNDKDIRRIIDAEEILRSCDPAKMIERLGYEIIR